HPGVKFTNGRAVTAADVKWSIERAVNPKTQGPGAGFFHSIVGADKMTAGTAETMDGITAVDDHTVKFTLAQPDATFLNVLALNFASVVPKEAVQAVILSAPTIVDRQQLETSYVTLNTQVKPFDNAKVRQAVNMAINKDRIVRIINGRATPANQVLPPLMPGYDQNYKGYAYDPEKAKALLAEAGLKDGFSTQIYTSNT
ncbi:MAG: hypothetical protein E5X69_28525, partial [Mesorhizobium sp.]